MRHDYHGLAATRCTQPMIRNVDLGFIIFIVFDMCLLVFALGVNFGDGISIGYRILAVYYFGFYIRIDV